jgi:hypothetical protein
MGGLGVREGFVVEEIFKLGNVRGHGCWGKQKCFEMDGTHVEWWVHAMARNAFER